MTIGAVVVNLDRADLLRPCLASLRVAAAHAQIELQTIVVDNGSVDHSAAMVRAEFPEMQLVALPANVGFPGAVQTALAAGCSEWVLLLNNDATLAPDALAHLLGATAAPDVAAVAAQMRFAATPDVVNSAGIGVDVLGVAYDRCLGELAAGGPHEPVEVFGASAGAALYRRSALEAAGGFDERYFIYLEDVDVAWRCRMAGWRAVYVADAVVWHHHAATAGHGSDFKYFHVGRNRVRMLARNAESSHLLRYGAAMLAYDLAYVTFVAVRERNLAPLRGRVAGLREWRSYRTEGAARRRSVVLEPRRGFAAALRRSRAWRQGGSLPAGTPAR